MLQENIKKGLLTELQCELDFSGVGFVVSRLITLNSRYDYIVNINGKLIRIQCKTRASYDGDNAFLFLCCSTNWNSKSLHSYSKEEIDYYYIRFKDKSYLFPVELDNKKNQNFTIRNEK